MRSRYVALVEKATEAVAKFSESLPLDAPQTIDKAALKQLARLEALRARLQGELDHYNGLFKAWRASTLHTRVETYQRAILLDTLRGVELTDDVKPDLDTFPPDLQFAWSTLGVAATVNTPTEPVEVPATGENEVLVRIPRRTIVNVYGKDAEGRAVLRESKRQLVMDSACELAVIKLRRSIWAKRGVTLGFNELGGLASFKQETESAAAAAATTAGEVPAKVTGSVEGAVKLRKGLGELDSQGLTEELARVKQEAEKKQQEMTLAGLTATAGDKAELERLKQQAELLEQHRKIGEGGTLPAAATDQGSRKQQLELEKLEAEIAKVKVS